MVFNSCEEAKEFYNLYSWEMGFGVRFNRRKRTQTNTATRWTSCAAVRQVTTELNTFTYSRALLIANLTTSLELSLLQGTPRRENTRSIRTGCKAMIRLHRTKDHAWIVSVIVDSHNHALSETCGENKQWPSHGDIDPSTKDLIKRLRENRVSLGSICSILGGGDYLGHVYSKHSKFKKEFHSLVTDITSKRVFI